MNSALKAFVAYASATAILGAVPGVAAAQDTVDLVVLGHEASGVYETLRALVSGTDARVVEGSSSPAAVGEADYLLSVDSESGVVAVLRRSDRARFETGLESAVVDAYALAVVAVELLEVARAGGDPHALGYAAAGQDASGERAEATTTASAGEAAEARDDPAATSPEESAEPEESEESGADSERPPATSPREPSSRARAFTVGVGAELWGSFGVGGIILVQPNLFAELLFVVGDRLLVGAGLFVSGFGEYTRETAAASVTYHRYDFGARGTAGWQLGRFGTQLLTHLRLSGGVVTGAGRAGTVNPRTATATQMGWALGIGVEVRQALFLGLEAYLLGTADVLPAPVEFVAFDQTLLSEGPVRIGGTLGLTWRIE